MPSTDGERSARSRRSAGDTTRLIARLAAKQHGVVAVWQLRAAGISDMAISTRVANGQLRRVHRGVVAVAGAELTEAGYWMAATLALGEGAVLSHATAAKAWGILDRSGPITVSRPSGGRCALRGVRLYMSRQLLADDVSHKGALPLTTVPRTLLDLAGLGDDRQLADAFSASRRLHLLDPASCRGYLARRPGRRGIRRLRELLDRFEPIHVPSLSELQDRVLALCLKAGLPTPLTEVRIGNRIVDFLWPEHKVILEVDGYAYHHHRFDEDRDRDLDHEAMGYRTIRVTYRMIRDDPEGVVRRIAAVLEQAAAHGGRLSPTDPHESLKRT